MLTHFIKTQTKWPTNTKSKYLNNFKDQTQQNNIEKKVKNKKNNKHNKHKKRNKIIKNNNNTSSKSSTW